MQIFINANESQEAEIREGIAISGSRILFARSLPDEDQLNADVFFILDTRVAMLDYEVFRGKPVYINEVVQTLEEMNTPANVSRINAWPGFLKRDIWEIATTKQGNTVSLFNLMNRKAEFVADIPGFVSARILAMIINEAHYTLDEGVSSKEEIDLAMKTGTNYPHGPFEWEDLIGRQKIYDLLQHLSQTNSLYQPAFTI